MHQPIRRTVTKKMNPHFAFEQTDRVFTL